MRQVEMWLLNELPDYHEKKKLSSLAHYASIDFSGEMNYLANKMLSLGVKDIKQPFPEETVMLDGEDITAQVKEAWDFLVEHAFVM